MSTPDTSGRIIALDILRGYFIFVIASIHLFYLPSFLGLFDGRGQLWFSDADGFFFISGLLIGITRHKDLQRAGLWAATTHTWARARTLFVATVVLTFLYTYLGRLLTIAGTPGVKTGLDTTSSWLDLLIRTLTLQYSYGWTDFLIYYVAFLVVTPLLLWLMSRRLWWAALALTLAAWIWHWSNISI
ncbi:MAG TPA: OpgC domain-containing protein, partial [Candidatus Saccharimonas sp.]|nr:OpgC domain-containing protein [Candidatus Saccharimonas sp.]